MICPHCKHEKTKVLDSRDSSDKVRRRRKCPNCFMKFTTYEAVDEKSEPTDKNMQIVASSVSVLTKKGRTTITTDNGYSIIIITGE